MHIEYVVVGCFDARFAGEIEQIWNELNYEAMEPHITLADFTNLDVELFKRDFNQFFMNRPKVPIHFNSIGCFLATNTLFLAPTMTQALWSLHREFHERFSNHPHHPHSYYLPQRWVPHCTLKSKVGQEEMTEMMTYCVKNLRLQETTMNEVKLIELTYDDGKIIEVSTIISQPFS